MPRTVKSLRRPAASPPRITFRLTHPDRVVFHEPDITKRDLAVYYAGVAEWLLPHAAGRPLSVVRCPVGIGGQCFFQKHPPAGLPAVVQRISIREKEKEAQYLLIDSAEGLVALVQHGVIEVHTWTARGDDVEKPDRLVFDLDPDPAVEWKAVVDGAALLRRILSGVGLAAFVKTTGGKGLHVVAPIRRGPGWTEVKAFCRAIADGMAASHPDEYTANPLKVHRRGRIFIDYLRNERGATAVAPYSVRARPAAPVATPVTWDELRRLRGPQQFTLENIPARLSRLARDPWAGMQALRQSLPKAAKF